MMSNYERTMELVDAANESAGASQKQFEKTLESLETKLNKLQNAWNEFTMHLANDALIKGAVDVLTSFLTVVNKILSVLPDGVDSIVALMASLMALKGAGKVIHGFFSIWTGFNKATTRANGVRAIAEELLVLKNRGSFLSALTEAMSGIGMFDFSGLSTAGATAIEKLDSAFDNLGATIPKAVNALKTFGSSLSKLVTNPVFLVIAALATGIYLAYREITKTEREIENLSGALDRLSTEASSLSEALSDIETQKEEFQSMSDLMDTLVVGTSSWNKQLLESNQFIADLIEQYPKFADYVTTGENGVRIISDDAWSKITEEIENRQEQIVNTQLLLTQRANKLQAEQTLTSEGYSTKTAERYLPNDNHVGTATARKAYTDYQQAVIAEQEAITANIQQQLMSIGDVSDDIAQVAAQIAANRYEVEEPGTVLDGATDDQIRQWALRNGYTITSWGGPLRNNIKIKDQLTGEEKAVTNEEIQVELNVLEAQKEAQELAEELSKIIESVSVKFGETAANSLDKEIPQDFFSKLLAGDDTIDLSIMSGLSEDELHKQLQELAAAPYENVYAPFAKAELATLLGLDPDEMTKDVSAYTNQLAQELEDSWYNIQKAQLNRNKELAATLAKGIEIPKQDGEIKDNAQNLVASFIKQLDEQQKAQYLNLADVLSENLGNDAFEAFTQGSIGLGTDIDTLSDVMTQLQEIDYTSSVSAFKDLSKYAENSKSAIGQMARAILDSSDNALNLGVQFQEVYSTILTNDDFVDDLDDAIEDNNGKILSADIKALAEQSSLLSDFLDNAEISATALAKAFTKVYAEGMSMNDISAAGLKLLSTMNQLDSVVEDAFDVIDDFEPARDTGEISEYYSDITDTMSEMLELGEYGNDQLSSYMGLMFGDKWTDAIDDNGGDLEKAAKKFENKINKIRDNLFGVWKDLASGYTEEINNFNEQQKTAFDVYRDASGAIVMEFGNMTTNEVVAAIEDIYGVSTDFAKAMLADFKNYSPDFAYKIKDNDFNAGIMDQMQAGTYNFNAGGSVNGDNYQTLFTQSELTNTANLIDMGYDEYIKKLGEMVNVTGDTTEKIENNLRQKGMFIVKDVEASTDDIVEDVKKTFNEIMTTSDESFSETEGLVKQFSLDNVFDIDALQNYAEAIGLTEEVVNQLLADIAKANLDDESFKMELDGVEIKKEDLAAEGANVTDVLDQAIENAHWEDVGKNIVSGLLGAIGEFTDYLAKAIGDGTDYGLSDAQVAMIKFFKEWNDSQINVDVELTPSINMPTSIGDDALSSALGENPFIAAIKEAQTALKETNSSSGTAKGWLNGAGRTEGKDTGSDKTTINDLPEPLDKLYNTYQRINKELRLINKYQERYDRLLEQAQVSGVELEKNLEKQIKYYTLLEKRASYAKETRQQQIKELLNDRIEYIYQDADGNDVLAKSKKLSNYFQWDAEYGLFTIDYKKINALADDRKNEKDLALYDALVEEISVLEGYQSDVEEANDNLEDARNALEDIEKKGRDAYRELEDRIYSAIVNREQERIDKLDQINNAIDDANDSLIDAIQKNIDKIRQDRENEETEEDIAKKERRLSYLRRDTSNANALEIKQLEEDLADQKQDYTDTLIDQKISELQDQNEVASEQRQQQIDLLQAQLDWDEKNGYFWEEAHTLIREGIDEEGKLVETSELVALLKSAEGWEGLSSVGQMEWYEELQSTAAKGWLWLKNNLNTALGLNTLQYQYRTGQVSEGDSIKYTQGNNKTQTGTVNDGNAIYEGKAGDGVYFEYSGDKLIQDAEGNWITEEDLKSARRFEEGKKISVRAKKNGSNEIVKIAATAGSDGIMYSNSNSKPFTNLEITTDGIYYTAAARRVVESNPSKYPGIKFKYATGGLADFTGPAWLDGSTSKPELVLNAKDTENFIQLKNVLRSLMNGGINSAANSSETNYEIHIEVDKLANDYDVEKVADKVKRMIVSDSKYRNVNAINKLR